MWIKKRLIIISFFFQTVSHGFSFYHGVEILYIGSRDLFDSKVVHELNKCVIMWKGCIIQKPNKDYFIDASSGYFNA